MILHLATLVLPRQLLILSVHTAISHFTYATVSTTVQSKLTVTKQNGAKNSLGTLLVIG